MRSSSAKVDTRGRAVSQASATASEWEGQSNNGDVRSIGSGISSGDIKTTISETSRTRSGDEGMKVSLAACLPPPPLAVMRY